MYNPKYFLPIFISGYFTEEMMTKTRIEIEKIVNSLNYYLLDTYIKNNKRRVIIQDNIGYKYDVYFLSLKKHSPYFIDAGNKFVLYNMSIWLKNNNPKIEVVIDNLYINAHSKMRFYHNVQTCEEYFESTWARIYSGYGCPVCSGKQVGEKTSLAYLRFDLAMEWHPKNNSNPNEYVCGSNEKVWWLCPNGHEYFARISHRVSEMSGCPKCYAEASESKIATQLKEYFKKYYNAKDEYKIFKNPKTNRWLPYDIYIPSMENKETNGVYIEVHGEQHYKLGEWHKRLAKENGRTPEEEFEYQRYKDKLKKNFAKKNGVYVEIDLRKIKKVEDAIKYVEKITKTL